MLKQYLMIFCFFLSTIVFASLSRTLDQHVLPNQLGEYKHIQYSPPNDFKKIDFYYVHLSNQYHASLYSQPMTSQAEAEFIGKIASDDNFIVAVNGGYYSPDFQPVGLFINEGKKSKRFARNRLLTSCITINEKGVVTLVPRCLQPPTDYYAMQTGPIIIEQGQVAYDISVLEKKSKIPKSFFDPNTRTIFAEALDGSLLVIVTSDVSMTQVAGILHNDPEIFGVEKIKTAINLDGGGSTGMYIRLKDRPIYIREKRPVKVLVLFS